jgi:hypothetical protein
MPSKKMKITFITDSYGGPRIHQKLEDVSIDQTFPSLSKIELIKLGHDVEIDYASFRKSTDLPFLFEKHKDADIYIIQTGIVDAYPRPLTQQLTISQSFLAKSLRRIIRLNRRFFIKYVRNKPWTAEEEFIKAIDKVCQNSKVKLIWINIAPINLLQEKETPGANKAIRNLNKILSNTIKNYSNCIELDIHNLLMSSKNYEIYLHPTDSHLNKLGNRFYANELLKLF